MIIVAVPNGDSSPIGISPRVIEIVRSASVEIVREKSRSDLCLNVAAQFNLKSIERSYLTADNLYKLVRRSMHGS